MSLLSRKDRNRAHKQALFELDFAYEIRGKDVVSKARRKAAFHSASRKFDEAGFGMAPDVAWRFDQVQKLVEEQ